ncbi:phosphoglycerate mutase [Nitritalea halalkaliphila LW7]|uniref:Phosphoglycerate mutase n=1 Tax=Nitritalea halalkaliphila LW7 TaxID=1189621 RepID=I5BT97_9BACT|nr:histidine phosphatase family protein [Nitritalea halalkaliphila]EIM72799.1 phosphoglycerate mutase [Nitritalea halalkaliphila LW7]
MSSKKIYLIRHGQTDYNLRGVVQGSGIDAPLNERGRAQAAAFFQRHQAVPFDKIYVSALQRTRQSVEPFLELGIPVESLAELNEISWGDYEGLPMTPEQNQYYFDMLARWASGDLDHAIAGGESPNQVVARLRKGFARILSPEREAERLILVCMHGRAIRMALSMLCDTPLAEMDQYAHQNLGLYVLSRANEEGPFHVEVANQGPEERDF